MVCGSSRRAHKKRIGRASCSISFRLISHINFLRFWGSGSADWRSISPNFYPNADSDNLAIRASTYCYVFIRACIFFIEWSFRSPRRSPACSSVTLGGSAAGSAASVGEATAVGPRQLWEKIRARLRSPRSLPGGVVVLARRFSSIF